MFKLIKENGGARRGEFTTNRGTVQTPAFMNVATAGAIKGAVSAEDFMKKMEELGVTTVICTDISRDGAMQGSNNTLYKELSEKFNIDLVASGGVSDINDIRTLTGMNLYGAIIGKAYYIGAIDLKEAIEVAK